MPRVSQPCNVPFSATGPQNDVLCSASLLRCYLVWHPQVREGGGARLFAALLRQPVIEVFEAAAAAVAACCADGELCSQLARAGATVLIVERLEIEGSDSRVIKVRCWMFARRCSFSWGLLGRAPYLVARLASQVIWEEPMRSPTVGRCPGRAGC